MHELISDLDDEIKQEFPNLYESSRSRRDDELTELAEGHVPDSHSKLADLLAADNSLANPEDIAMIPHEHTVWDVISLSVRERLVANAHEQYKSLEQEYEDVKDTLESMGYISGLEGERGKRTWYIYWEKEDDTEVVVCNNFKSEYDAWKWLELNEEKLDENLKVKP